MSKIGLIVTINKFVKFYQSDEKTFVCDTLEMARKNLINYLAEEFNKIVVDFPIELDDLRYVWFDESYVDADIFRYKVFNNGIWEEPWEAQDVYSDVYDMMFEKECENPIDYGVLYCETTLEEDKSSEIKTVEEVDEEHAKEEQFENDSLSKLNDMNLNEMVNKYDPIKLFEKKFHEIIEQSKNENHVL